jgi:hypothetical protein
MKSIGLQLKMPNILILETDDKRQTVMNKVNPSPKLDMQRRDGSAKRSVIPNSKSSKIVAVGGFGSPNIFNTYEHKEESLSTFRKCNAVAPSFNPFEVASNPEIPWNRHTNYVENKSRSDLGYWGSFLSKIEDSNDSFPKRKSELSKPSKFNAIKNQFTWDAESMNSGKGTSAKLSFETPSGKEDSSNHENSILSNDFGLRGRTSEGEKKSIMIYKYMNDNSENTPTFSEAMNLVS